MHPDTSALRRGLAACGLLLLIGLPFVLAALFVVPSTPVARERALVGFVGSATCAGCHVNEAAAWRESDHARAMAAVTLSNVLGDFSGVTVTDGRHTASFRREGERFLIRTDGPGGVVADFPVSETFGVDPLQQYLVLFPDGRRQVLPWAWDSRPADQGGQRWYHLMPEEALPAGDALHWTGRDQNWNFMCAACHSTGLTRGYDAQRDRYDTAWTEISVGCEACHGAGAAHIAWAQAGRPPGMAHRGLAVAMRDGSGGAWRFAAGDARGIARWEGPAREGVAAQLDSCAPCHARARPIVADPQPGARFLDTHAPVLLQADLYHADGQMLGEVFEWGSFVQSRMQRAGVTCGDCHDPHSGRLRAEGNAVCAQCHLPARFDTPQHHHHAEGASCASCHMPVVTYMGVDRRRDHSFRVPRPDIARVVGAPDVCTACHTDRSPEWAAQRVVEWHGPTRRETPHPALAIAAGRRNERGADAALAALAMDRSQPSILRATALTLLPVPPTQPSAQAVGATLLDPEPLVRATALRALEGLHPRNRLHAARLLGDPVRLVRIEAARALAPVPLTAMPEPARPAFARAWEELIASERIAAERPEAHVNIAGLLAQRGDATGAVTAWQAALALDATHLPALVNMAEFESRRGRHAEALTALDRAIAAHPFDAAAHHAHGLALVRAGNPTSALPALARAAELAPEVPRFAYVRAIALNSLGQRTEARQALRDVVARHPRDRDSLLALVTLERDLGNRTEASRIAAILVALDPGDREAAALLAELSRR